MLLEPGAIAGMIKADGFSLCVTIYGAVAISLTIL